MIRVWGLYRYQQWAQAVSQPLVAIEFTGCKFFFHRVNKNLIDSLGVCCILREWKIIYFKSWKVTNKSCTPHDPLHDYTKKNMLDKHKNFVIASVNSSSTQPLAKPGALCGRASRRGFRIRCPLKRDSLTNRCKGKRVQCKSASN